MKRSIEKALARFINSLMILGVLSIFAWWDLINEQPLYIKFIIFAYSVIGFVIASFYVHETKHTKKSDLFDQFVLLICGPISWFVVFFTAFAAISFWFATALISAFR
jgi:hypothetical protein